MQEQSLTAEQQAELSTFITEMNDKLDSAVQDSTQHAFNYGCSISLIPMLVIVILVLFLSRFNWIMTLAAATISLLIALGLAALVASTARKNASEQTYRLHIAPEIDRNNRRLNLTRSEFARLAGKTLPSYAPLLNHLEMPGDENAAHPDSGQVHL